MPVYEIRRNPDGTEMSMSPALGAPGTYPWVLDTDGDGRPMKIIASFWAPSWPAAIKAEKAIMGWLKETWT